MKTKILHSLGAFLGLIIFSGALWALHQELKAYHFHDIVKYIRDLPVHQLLTALTLTFLSYFVMIGYDILALKYIHHPLEYPKIALASFIGYAFSNNIGLSMIAGASVLGADLLNLKKNTGLGAPVASIGGAGTFDGIFLAGIIAVLLA